MSARPEGPALNPRLTEYHRALLDGRADGVPRLAQRAVLALASLPFGWAVALRNRGYDRGWLPTVNAGVPVISVGNLTAGGTGKTPCVEHLARWLSARNVRFAVLSRGYGRPVHRSSFSGLNDEALVLRDNVPGLAQYQGADRAASARLAVTRGRHRLLLLDDAFQHRRLARDLDVVLLDATNPWGYGRLLPRGLLREPVETLARAGAVVLTRCDQVATDSVSQLREEVRRLAPHAVVAETVHRPVDLINSDLETAPLESAAGRAAVAFCGLGNPQAFRNTLLGLGARLIAFRTYPDHHAYTPADLRDLQRWVTTQPPGGVVLTSQKDLVKLSRRHLGGRELWAVRVRLEFVAGQEELERLLEPLVALAAAGPDARAA